MTKYKIGVTIEIEAEDIHQAIDTLHMSLTSNGYKFTPGRITEE